MIKKIISNILNCLINITLFNINLIIILFNILKIYTADILIFQNKRIGFGNIFTSIDLARKIFEKKRILFINFYDSSRFHNKKIFDFLCEKKVILYTSIKFRKSRFGEYDHYLKKGKKNFFQSILIRIIKFFNKNRSNSFNIPELYSYSEKKNKSLKIKKYNFLSENHQWLTYYYYLVEKKPYIRINKKNKIIEKLIENNKQKSICIYKREKKIKNKITKNYSLFYRIIKILSKKNFQIFLVGEYFDLIKSFPQIKKLVSLPEKNGIYNKDLNLAMQIISDYYIGDTGGGSYFSMYKKKSLIMGNSEGNTFPKRVKVFNYRIFYKNKNIKKNLKIKRFINNQIKINKTALDPDLLYKLNLTIKNEDESKIINYIKKNF